MTSTFVPSPSPSPARALAPASTAPAVTKNQPARWFFHRYARHRVRRAFSQVGVRGLPQLEQALERGPVIVAPNHVAFWDVFVILLLEQRLGADGFALMDRANYDRLPFLGWIGALPLDRARPKSAYRDVLLGARVLDRPGRILFVFPQGRQQPAHLPLRFHSGVAVAARSAGVPIVPVGLRYEFGEDPKPEIFVSIGAALEATDSARVTCRALEAAVSAELRAIDGELQDHRGEFTPLVGSRHQGLPWGSRFLSRWARPGES